MPTSQLIRKTGETTKIAVRFSGSQHARRLLQKMETLEASRLPLEQKQRELEKAVEVSWRDRPNADRICREWSRVTELWEGATDEEREELMQAMVVRVEMDEKEEGTCEVALMPQVPSLASDWLGLTSRMGAGLRLDATNPMFNPWYTAADLYIPPGGLLRKRLPRPDRQGTPMPRAEN